MYCSHCGGKLVQDAAFCGVCGAAVVTPDARGDNPAPIVVDVVDAPAERTRRAILALAVVFVSVVVLGVMAYFAVPVMIRLNANRVKENISSNENAAIGALLAINKAEDVYAQRCASGGYAASLDALAKAPTDGGTGFIGSDLGVNGVTKAGYRFTIEGRADWPSSSATCNGSSAVVSYFVRAEPVEPGTSGIRYFATNGTHTIYESALPISNPIEQSPWVRPIGLR